jgi:hypothetical protein
MPFLPLILDRPFSSFLFTLHCLPVTCLQLSLQDRRSSQGYDAVPTSASRSQHGFPRSWARLKKPFRHFHLALETRDPGRKDSISILCCPSAEAKFALLELATAKSFLFLFLTRLSSPLCFLIICARFHRIRHLLFISSAICHFSRPRHFVKTSPERIHFSNSTGTLFQFLRFPLISWTSSQPRRHKPRLTLARSRFQWSDSVRDDH